MVHDYGVSRSPPLKLRRIKTGYSVTANMLALGASDSGFESQYPDKIKMFRLFTKKKEDFVCEKCGVEVKGNGYTNHCPKCLWSKHVDVFPGDRLEDCGGLMKPILVEKEKGHYVLTHKCLICGGTKRNKTEEKDNFDEIIKLSNKIGNQSF